MNKPLYDYDKAIELDTNHVAAYNNRGSAKNALKQYEQAIKITIKPLSLTLTCSCLQQPRSCHYEQAITDYDKAIELDRNYAAAYYNRAITYKDLGDDEQAIKDFQHSKCIRPNDYFQRAVKRSSTRNRRNRKKKTEETENFQQILQEAKTEYQSNAKKWLWTSAIFSALIIILLAILMLDSFVFFILELIRISVRRPIKLTLSPKYPSPFF